MIRPPDKPSAAQNEHEDLHEDEHEDLHEDEHEDDGAPAADLEQEAQWLLAKERDPSAPAPSEQLATEHAELHALLTSLPEGAPDDAWQQAILRQVRSAPPAAPAPPWWRRSWLSWTVGGGLAAAATLTLWLLARPARPELEVTTVSRLDKRSQEVAVGDRLVVDARPSGAADLRVFRSSGELVARCPSGPACTSSGSELRIELILDAPGRYHVILAAGLKRPLPETGMGAGTDARMDAYIDAARAADARITVREVEAH